MNGQNPLISVIVPVYKVEKYLRKCIDSILAQTYTNMEIILVDDGSPDNCPGICDEYEKKDPRVKVIHKENGGLSSARNAGLAIAAGEYIGFVDSDDYIAPNMYEFLSGKLLEYGADISCCSAMRVYEDSEKKEYQQYTSDDIVMDNISAMKNLFLIPRIGEGSLVWNKLYHCSLFYELRFAEGRIYEDTAIVYQLYYYAQKVIFTDVPLYFYLQRVGSIMGSGFSPSILYRLLAWEEAVEFCKAHAIPLVEQAQYRCIETGLMLLYMFFVSGSNDKNIFDQLCIRTLKCVNRSSWSYLGFKRKVQIIVLSISSSLFYILSKGYLFIKKQLHKLTFH